MNNTGAMESGAEDWLSRLQRCYAQGDIAGALDVALGAVAASPDDLAALHALAVLHLLSGQAVNAAGAFRSLLRIEKSAERYFDLAVALEACGEPSSARAAYQQALSLEPTHFKSRLNLCALLLALRLPAEARVEAALLVDNHPLQPEAWCSLGHALFANFDPRAADEAFSRARSLAPQYLPAALGQVVSLAMCGEITYSNDLLDELKALRLMPELVRSIPQARETLELSLADLEDIFLTALFERYRRGDWECRPLLERGLGRLAGTVREDPERLVRPIQAFHALAIGLDYADYRVLARRVAARDTRAIQTIVHQLRPEQRTSDRRLHLGYISPAFRDHPSAYLIRGMFRSHERARFSVTVYCIGVDDGSEVRLDIISGCDNFVSLATLNDHDAAQRIHADGVDILIQFEGFLDGTRNGILALRPAPIQVAHIGVVGALEANYFDYRFSEELSDQLDTQTKFPAEEVFEQRVRFSEMYWPYGAPMPPWSIPVTRSDYGLPAQAFVFCSFNNDFKISEEVLMTWLEILKATPGSILWLRATNEGIWKRCVSCAVSNGVAPERMVRASDCPNNQHLARIRLADLFLDTFDYNAHTTALDSMWMGVPILTKRGRTPASALCAGMLNALGLNELIACTRDEYIAAAIALAKDRSRYQTVARKLMSARSRSTLFNTPHKVRLYERAYETMWARYIAGLPPADIDVPPLEA